jgi:hypothetical protein
VTDQGHSGSKLARLLSGGAPIVASLSRVYTIIAILFLFAGTAAFVWHRAVARASANL